MAGPEDNPMDEQPIDREEYEAWEKATVPLPAEPQGEKPRKKCRTCNGTCIIHVTKSHVIPCSFCGGTGFEPEPPKPPPVDVDELERLMPLNSGRGYATTEIQNTKLSALIQELRHIRQRIGELETENNLLRGISLESQGEANTAWDAVDELSMAIVGKKGVPLKELTAALDRLKHGGGGGM